MIPSVDVSITEKTAIERTMMKNLFFKNFIYILLNQQSFQQRFQQPVENFFYVKKSVYFLLNPDFLKF